MARPVDLNALQALTHVAGSLDYNGYPEAAKKVRAAADELALARAVVEVVEAGLEAGSVDRRLVSVGEKVRAYRAHVGGKSGG